MRQRAAQESRTSVSRGVNRALTGRQSEGVRTSGSRPAKRELYAAHPLTAHNLQRRRFRACLPLLPTSHSKGYPLNLTMRHREAHRVQPPSPLLRLTKKRSQVLNLPRHDWVECCSSGYVGPVGEEQIRGVVR